MATVSGSTRLAYSNQLKQWILSLNSPGKCFDRRWDLSQKSAQFVSLSEAFRNFEPVHSMLTRSPGISNDWSLTNVVDFWRHWWSAELGSIWAGIEPDHMKVWPKDLVVENISYILDTQIGHPLLQNFQLTNEKGKGRRISQKHLRPPGLPVYGSDCIFLAFESPTHWIPAYDNEIRRPWFAHIIAMKSFLGKQSVTETRLQCYCRMNNNLGRAGEDVKIILPDCWWAYYSVVILIFNLKSENLRKYLWSFA